MAAAPLPPIIFFLIFERRLNHTFKNMFVCAFSVFLYNLCCIQNLDELNAEGMSYFLKPTLVMLHVSASKKESQGILPT